MKKSLRWAVILVIGVWFAAFQLAGVSQGAVIDNSAPAGKSAPAPFNYTGLPKVIVVSGTDYEMGVQYGEQASAASSIILPSSRADSTRPSEAQMSRRI